MEVAFHFCSSSRELMLGDPVGIPWRNAIPGGGWWLFSSVWTSLCSGPDG